MIETRIQEILETRGKTRYWLAKQTGIGYATLLRLERSGLAKGITFETLSSLCEALDCQPGDILVFKAKPRARKRR